MFYAVNVQSRIFYLIEYQVHLRVENDYFGEEYVLEYKTGQRIKKFTEFKALVV
jgi:hypothetical protein